VCATALATTGIYGVIAETVAARKREIAIRMALGAPRIRLVRGLVSKTLLFALIGEAVGLRRHPGLSLGVGTAVWRIA
jgi:ABC-type antimicrobial peptide transport system permease subunit